MSCRHDHKSENCVCDIVRAIADAQQDIVEFCCDVSCEQSIDQLLNPAGTTGFDTVPFILYCKKSCSPFLGYGGVNQAGEPLNLVSSYIFRVKSVDDDCCAKLELLKDANHTERCKDACEFKPCDMEGADLVATGACITVDLKDFMGITCLSPVNALR